MYAFRVLLTTPRRPPGGRIDTRHIPAKAKAEKGILLLLDIDQVLQEDERLARWASPEDEAHAV
jgi:hypothetical protein